MATVKKVTPKTTEETAVVEDTKKEVRQYKATDLIPVRSITQGELLMAGKKSGILYRWSAYGDITEVEYQDLYTLKSSRSGFVMKPRFVIEDEELLAQPQWKEIKAVYDSMFTVADIDSVFKMTAQQLRKNLPQMPEGFIKAILIEAANRIESGSLDSINKIKAIDDVCGSDLKCLIK